jgi:5'-methylthioadenosine phosphorylase
MDQVKIGIIGGSGLYNMAELTERREVSIDTPFGPPSDSFILGRLGGKEVAFLARHGRGHRILPSELNFRANIYAMKTLGVERILSASAVGSLKQEVAPLDILLPDQFIDRTRGRISTFFGDGVAAHVTFADPICLDLLEQVSGAAVKAGIPVKKGGTYVCMEGPAFSTRAESNLYRSWGADVIGMTNLQEAKLAREAEICYVTLALITDYDCWHTAHESVTVDMIVGNLIQNSRNAQSILLQAICDMSAARNCGCADALKNAIMTDPSLIPAETRKKLDRIIGKYVKNV